MKCFSELQYVIESGGERWSALFDAQIILGNHPAQPLFRGGRDPLLGGFMLLLTGGGREACANVRE